MRKELIFHNEHNNYSIDKCYFRKEKKTIDINEVDTTKIVLPNKTPYSKEGANKYYIGYVGNTGFRPLHIIITKIKLYTSHVNVLAGNKELLKYIEIWDKTVDLFHKKHNKYYIITPYIMNAKRLNKIRLYNEKFRGNKKLIKR